MPAGSEEAWHGGARRLEWEAGGVWIRTYGTQKQQEGEVAVASSPSYKCGAGVTALAITPASF